MLKNQLVLIGTIQSMDSHDEKLAIGLMVDTGDKQNVFKVMFGGRQAEVLTEYVSKGEMLSITGHLDKKGKEYFVQGERFQMLS